MPKVTLYLNDATNPGREFAQEVELEVVPRKGELVTVCGYGGALTVEEIHHRLNEKAQTQRICVFFSCLPPRYFDSIIAADPSWHES